MKSNILFQKQSITIKFNQKPPRHVGSRLVELGFSTKDNKSFVRSKKLAQNEHEYLQGMLGHKGLGMAYIPAAEKGFILDTTVPDSMGHEMHIAIRKIKKSIGQPLFDYVAGKLDYSNDELKKIAMKLVAMGPSKIVITGIQRGHYIGNYCYEKNREDYLIKTMKVGTQRSGTGDIFASIIAADAVNGVNFHESVRKASTFIKKCILKAIEMDIPLTDGVPFEELLTTLK